MTLVRVLSHSGNLQTDHGLTPFFMISFNCLSSYGLEGQIEKEE